MKNFIFKSADADLQKMFQSIETLNKNILYVTHQVDFIRKEIVKLNHDKDLQSTVDKYFSDDNAKDIPDSDADLD